MRLQTSSYEAATDICALSGGDITYRCEAWRRAGTHEQTSMVSLSPPSLPSFERAMRRRVARCHRKIVTASIAKVPDAMAVANQGGAIILLKSSGEEKPFGYRRDRLLGTRLLDTLGHKMKNLISEPFAERLSTADLRSAEDALAMQ